MAEEYSKEYQFRFTGDYSQFNKSTKEADKNTEALDKTVTKTIKDIEKNGKALAKAMDGVREAAYNAVANYRELGRVGEQTQKKLSAETSEILRIEEQRTKTVDAQIKGIKESVKAVANFEKLTERSAESVRRMGLGIILDDTGRLLSSAMQAMREAIGENTRMTKTQKNALSDMLQYVSGQAEYEKKIAKDKADFEANLRKDTASKIEKIDERMAELKTKYANTERDANTSLNGALLKKEEAWQNKLEAIGKKRRKLTIDMNAALTDAISKSHINAAKLDAKQSQLVTKEAVKVQEAQVALGRASKPDRVLTDEFKDATQRLKTYNKDLAFTKRMLGELDLRLKDPNSSETETQQNLRLQHNYLQKKHELEVKISEEEARQKDLEAKGQKFVLPFDTDEFKEAKANFDQANKSFQDLLYKIGANAEVVKATEVAMLNTAEKYENQIAEINKEEQELYNRGPDYSLTANEIKQQDHYNDVLAKSRVEMDKLADEKAKLVDLDIDSAVKEYSDKLAETTPALAKMKGKALATLMSSQVTETDAKHALGAVPEEFAPASEIVKDMNDQFHTMKTLAVNVGKSLVRGVMEAQEAVLALMNTMTSPRIIQNTSRNMAEMMKGSLGDAVDRVIEERRKLDADKPDTKISEENDELKTQKELNEDLEIAERNRMRKQMSDIVEAKQGWEQATKAKKEYVEVGKSSDATNIAKGMESATNAGKKLSKVWSFIVADVKKAKPEFDTSKSLLRVILLSDKERRREEQKLTLLRQRQHLMNQMVRITSTDGKSTEVDIKQARQLQSELNKIKRIREKIRQNNWAMTEMESGNRGRQSEEFKKESQRLKAAREKLVSAENTLYDHDSTKVKHATDKDYLSGLDKRIEELQGKLNNLYEKGDYGENTDKFEDELESLKAEKGELAEIATLDAERMARQERYDEIKKRTDDMARNGTAFEDYRDNAHYLHLKDNARVLEEQLQELLSTSQQFDSSGNIVKQVDINRVKELTAQLEATNRKIRELQFQPIHDGLVKIGKFAKTHIKSGLKKALHAVTNGIKKLASWAGRAAKSIAGIFSSKSAKSGSNGISKAVEKLTRKFSNLWSMLMTRFKRRAIAAVFNDIKGVFVEMANLNPQFNESINKMVNSARRLGAQILAILEPIIVRIGPIVEKLADMLASVADKVAQFTANLFGFSDWLGNDKYTKAEKGNYDFAKSMDETTSSTNKATKAAKEYENTVMGFDQLNKLNDKEDAEEASDEAEAQLERVNTRLNAFNLMAKGIRKAFENGDYEEAGKRIANTLGYLANILGNKFGWKKNSEQIKTFLGNVTTTINSFIKWFPAEKIGEVFGDIANTLINSLDFILNDPDHKLDFAGLGDKIGKLLISAFKTIEWDKVGRVLVGVFSALGDIIKGALTATIEDENGNKTTLATAFGNALKDMLKGASEAFDPEHASDILSTIINALNDFIIALTSDPELFGNVGAKLGEAFTKSMEKIDKDKMTTAFKQVASSLGQLIGNFLHSVPWADVFSNLGDLLGILINGIVEGITGGEGSGSFGSTLIVALLGALLGKNLLGNSGGILGAIVALLIAGGGLGGLFGGNSSKNPFKDGKGEELFPGVKDKYGNPWTADDSATDGRTIKRAKEWAPAQAQGNDLKSIASRWLVDGGNTIFSFFHQFFDKDSYQEIYDEFGDMPICIAQILMGVRSIGTAVVNNASALMDTTDVLADWFHLYEKEAFKHMTPEQIEEYKNMTDEEKQYYSYANMGLFQDRNKPIDWPEVSRETLQRLQEDVSDWYGRAKEYVESMKGKTTEEIEAQQNEERRKAMEAMGMEYTERDASRYSWKNGDGDGEAEAITAQASDVKSIKDAVVDKPEEDATEEKDDKIAQMIEAIQNKDTNLVIKIGSQTIAELAVKGFLAMGAQYGSGV